MKILRSSHREKKRYLLLQGKDADKKNIEEAILQALGILGFAQASPQVIKFGRDFLVLAINRESINKIRTSFLISDKDIQIAKVAGSIKKLTIH
jgi:RNase P/RNase MRP subunit POP5